MDDRYSRQALFQPIGRSGQTRLADSSVLIVGCGALGAAHAETLARAGVGRLRIVDRDFVEFSNLQRQTLYTESDARERLPKAVAAKNRLAEINSEVAVEALIADVNSSNILRFFDGIDVILDGSDNFQVRYLINDASVKTGKPWIYGAAVASYGTTMTVVPGKTPCLRCIFEEMPAAGSGETCDTSGVIQPIVASISAIQTTEALKLLTGSREALHGSLIQVDVWANDHRAISLGAPEVSCKSCSQRNFEFLEAVDAALSTALCGRDAVQVRPPNATELDLGNLAGRLTEAGEVKVNDYLLRVEIEGFELTVFKDARAIIRGTDDVAAARSLYARYVGN